jgi:hypothetical protein
MKNKILLSVLVVSLAMNIGVASMFGLRWVQTRAVDPPKGCSFAVKDSHLFTLLGLSAEQSALIMPMAHQFHEHIDKLSGEIHQKRNLMLTLMEQEPIANDQINRIRLEIAALQASMQQQVFEHILHMKKQLNPDQKQIFFKALRRSFITQNLNVPH